MKINIAIDGPSGAGKSTIAKLVATKLGYVHLDTGAMYRLTAYKAHTTGVAINDEIALVEMLKNTEIKILPDGSIYLDTNKINDEIRTEEISTLASQVSKFKTVREYLVNLQQKIALDKGYILDGRDIGTVVLKDAEVKIFLTATNEARAQRRQKQNESKGIKSDYQKVLEDIINRDYQDTSRENSPLQKANDANLIDCSDLSIDEVVFKILNQVNEVIR